MKNNPPIFSNLTDIFKNKFGKKSLIGNKLSKQIFDYDRSLKPNFPRQIQIETTNICNHGCTFCAYTIMKRPKRHIDEKIFSRIVKECYELGARDIGLFSGAEPLTCKKIDQYIRLCKKIGYEHIYISTNGSIGNFNKLKDIVDAGISSIKFSINAGKKETYKDVHGKDDFEKVINNVKNISKYKNENDSKFWLSVSFVGMKNTKNEFPILKKILKDSVDEMVYYDASNQSGQMKDFPDPPYTDCHLPFNKAHFSVEGYMKACCNDYENLLVVDDINGKDILSIWNGPRFKALRKQHLDDKLSNTLCANCIRSKKTIAEPLNKKLHAKSQNK